MADAFDHNLPYGDLNEIKRRLQENDVPFVVTEEGHVQANGMTVESWPEGKFGVRGMRDGLGMADVVNTVDHAMSWITGNGMHNHFIEICRRARAQFGSQKTGGD